MATQQPIPVKDVASAAVRKRRRRAPAGGAADDCFTCSKRNVKCDRRRPYCSQCLEVGNECSGYKTQLTWNVGVASRGKLRGLSLPIAKAPPVNPGPKKSSPVRSRTSSSAANCQWSDHDDTSRRNTRDELDLDPEHNGSGPSTPFHSYDMISISQPESTTPISQAPWAGISYSASLDGPKYQKMSSHLGPLPIVSDVLSSSLDSVSDVDYLSPMSHSFPRDDLPFVHSPIIYENYTAHSSPVPPQSPVSAIMIDPRSAPTSCPSLVYAPSEHGSSLASHMDSFEVQLSQKLMRDCDTLSETFYPYWA
jgi:hypothetical protein